MFNPDFLRKAGLGFSENRRPDRGSELNSYEATQREKKLRCVPVVKPTLETLGATFCRFLAGYREHREGWDPVSWPSRGLTWTSKLLFVHGATPLPAVVCPEPIVPKTLMMLAPPVTKPTAHGENQQAARQDASHYAVPPLSLRPAGRSSGSTINHNGVACHIRKEPTPNPRGCRHPEGVYQQVPVRFGPKSAPTRTSRKKGTKRRAPPTARTASGRWP